MAGIFSPEQYAAFQNTGNIVGNILRERFWDKQAENFMANDYAKFQQDTSAFNQNLSKIEDPDQLANAFREYQNNVVIPFQTMSTMRYKDNPKIMAGMQRLFEANKEGLSNFIEMRGQAIQSRQAGVQESQEARAQEMQPYDIEHKQATTELLKAEKGYYNRLPTGKGGGSKEPQTPEDFLKIARNPKDYKAKQDMDNWTLSQVVTRVTNQHKGNFPDLYPSGEGVWGSDPELNKKNTLEFLQDRNLLDDVKIAGRMAKMAGNTPEVIDVLQKGGVDPNAIALVFPGETLDRGAVESLMRSKINDNTKPQDVVSVITGTPQSANFHFEGLNQYYQDVIDDLDSYHELTPALRQIFDVVQKDKMGNPVIRRPNAETGRMETEVLDAKTNEEFQKKLRDKLIVAAVEKILNRQVNPKTKEYQNIANFLGQVIDRFLPQLAQEYQPPHLAEEEKIKTPSILSMYNPANIIESASGYLIKKGNKTATELIKKGKQYGKGVGILP